ncbi:putative Peroxidase 48 [Mangifera indica]|uniref:putative Peroxidase 48 n=1 Tax=Mangifera indica TaxID=29780 RepID=UPI001CFBEA6D|nr:putative Peroxidase 48 [Mangifera indica]
MLNLVNKWVLLVLLISFLFSLRTPRKGTQREEIETHPVFSVFLQTQEGNSLGPNPGLEYDHYRDSCPEAEKIVRSIMSRLYAKQKDVPAALLRLFFHDCFIRGCDASLFLDDSHGSMNYSIERQAVPHSTLKGFDKIDLIKAELEKACPGVVSCADTLALATRDGILLQGGPYYPVFTGRRDSSESYFQEATAEIPKPDGNLSETLHLFSLRGFNERETVSLLGSHNIGKISCHFIQDRLYNFTGTGQPDPTIAADSLNELRLHCPANNNSSRVNDSAISSGSDFDTHYFRSLLRGRGLLFVDQQLMADEKTASLVKAYASGDGTVFRMDFARAMVKMSNLGVLSGSQGQVRINCSLPAENS